MIINVDSDEVVYDMVGIFRRRAMKRLGRHLPLPSDFKFSNWDLTRSEIDTMFEFESRQHLFDFGEAIPGAVQGVLELTDNHRVRIITSKSLSLLGKGTVPAMQNTVSWYNGVGLLGKVAIVFVENGKQAYPADVVIDDHPTMSWCQLGAANILFDRSHNQNLTGEPSGMWIRAADWDTILELIDIETNC